MATSPWTCRCTATRPGMLSGQENRTDQIQWLRPIVGRGVDADLTKAAAQWVARDTVACGRPSPRTHPSYSLRWSRIGGITAGTSGVDGGRTIRLSYDPQGMTTELREKWPHLSAYQVFKVRSSDLAQVPDALRGQVVAVEKAADGTLRRATSVQLPGVLDDLYADDAQGRRSRADRGSATPTLRLWAPTAQQVQLQVFDTATAATPSTTLDMARDDATGVWSVSGRKLEGRYYLYEVTVWAPGVQEVVDQPGHRPVLAVAVHQRPTQPGRGPLRAEAGAHGWDTLGQAEAGDAGGHLRLRTARARLLRQRPVRCPAALRGTFEAFALDGTNGMTTSKALADAGLSARAPAAGVRHRHDQRGQSSLAVTGPGGALSDLPATASSSRRRCRPPPDRTASTGATTPATTPSPKAATPPTRRGTRASCEFREMVAGAERRPGCGW